MSYFDLDMKHAFPFGGWRDTKKLVGVCVHTTEGSDPARPPSAVALTNYQSTSRTGSYHVVVDTAGVRVRQNTDDWVTWSTGNKGNYILLHLSFCAFSAWSRKKWLSEGKMLRAGAKTIAHWLKHYGWPAKKVPAALLPGALGHADTRVWGGTDHTDPGPNFPWPEFIDMVKDEMGVAAVRPVVEVPVPNLIDAEAAIAGRWIGDRLHDDERPCADGEGRYADFAQGSIYWHPTVTMLDGQHAAIAVPTRVYEVWSRLQWEQGHLGYPVRRHTVIPDTADQRGGDIQAFQGGIIYRRYGLDGAAIHGKIGNRWFQEGAETGRLGWPLADEEDTADGGRVQRFERGQMHWHPSGAIEILD